MFEKVADAASMLWQALDTQERIILAYALFALCGVLVSGRLQRRAELQREERLARRIGELLNEGR